MCQVYFLFTLWLKVVGEKFLLPFFCGKELRGRKIQVRGGQSGGFFLSVLEAVKDAVLSSAK